MLDSTASSKSYRVDGNPDLKNARAKVEKTLGIGGTVVLRFEYRGGYVSEQIHTHTLKTGFTPSIPK